MNNLTNGLSLFIKKNYVIIVVVIVIVAILYYNTFYGSYYGSYHGSYSRHEPFHKSVQGSFDSFLDKNVYLQYTQIPTNELSDGTMQNQNILGKKFYLTIGEIKECNSPSGEIDCQFNAAILKPEITDAAIFRLLKRSPDENKYVLRASTKYQDQDMDFMSPHLGQNLNIGNKSISIPLCFDDLGRDQKEVEFTVEADMTSNIDNYTDIKLRFSKTVNNIDKDFFVGICQDLVCTKENSTEIYRRLCLFEDPDKAIKFTIVEEGTVQKSNSNSNLINDNEQFEQFKQMPKFRDPELVYYSDIFSLGQDTIDTFDGSVSASINGSYGTYKSDNEKIHNQAPKSIEGMIEGRLDDIETNAEWNRNTTKN